MKCKHALPWALLLSPSVAGPLPGDEPKIDITAMIVRLPTGKLDLLGDNVAQKPDQTRPRIGSPEFTPGEMKAIRAQLALPETEAGILAKPSIRVADGQDAEITSGRAPLYFMVPAKDDLYRLQSVTGPGTTLKTKPVVRGTRIQVSLHLTHSELLKRAAIPGAPGLQAGIPMMRSSTVSTTLTLSDGASCLLAGSTAGEATILCFVTVQRVDTR